MSNYYTNEKTIPGWMFRIAHIDNYFGRHIYGYRPQSCRVPTLKKNLIQRLLNKIGIKAGVKQRPKIWKNYNTYNTYMEAKTALNKIIKNRRNYGMGI